MDAVSIGAFIGTHTTRARFHSLARFETAGFMSSHVASEERMNDGG
jgi:hypothetical protein